MTSVREKIRIDIVEETLRAYGLKFLKEEKAFLNKLIDKKRTIKNSASNTNTNSIEQISEDTGYSKEEVLEVINEEIMDKIESTSNEVKEKEEKES